MRHPLVVDIGFDLGTTVTKLTALADDGTRLVDHSVATTWDELGDGCAERDPQPSWPPSRTSSPARPRRWAPATATTARSPSARSGSPRWPSPACSSTPTASPAPPSSPGRLRRGSEQVTAVPPELAHDFPARTGLPVTHVASIFKIAWLRDQGLSLAGLQWLSLPEFVIASLGGRRVGELSLMGRTGFLDIHTGSPDLPALAHLGVGEHLVPELVGAGTPAGRIRADHPVVAARGAVLTVAGHDHAVAAAAAGASTTASAMDSFGTAEAFLVASGHVPDPDVVRELTTHGVSVYPHVVHGTTGLLAGMRTGLVLKRGAAPPRRRRRGRPRPGRPRLARPPRRPQRRPRRHRLLDVGPRRHRAPARRLPDPGKGLGGRRWTTAPPTPPPSSRTSARPGFPSSDSSSRAAGAGCRRSSTRAAPWLPRSRSPPSQPGPRGAALYGRWTATQGDSISSDLRPPAAYFTPVTETVSAGHAPPLAEEATP